MPSVVDAFMAVADAVSEVGKAARGAVDDLKEAVQEADRYRESYDAAAETTAGKTGTGGTDTGKLAASMSAVTGRV